MNPGNPNGGSGTQYFIGQFNGKKFEVAPEFKKAINAEDVKSIWLDAGTDNYAGVTWSDVPKEDGRRIFIGWMSNWAYAQKVPTEKWRSAMTLPWSLSVKNINGTPRLIGYPVKEVNTLRRAQKTALQLDRPTPLPESGLADIEFSTRIGMAKRTGFKLSNELGQSVSFYLDTDDNMLYFDRTNSGKEDFSEAFAGLHKVKRISNDEMISIRAIIDVASIEIFVDGGVNIFTEIFFPDENYSKIELIGSGPAMDNSVASMWEMKRIW